MVFLHKKIKTFFVVVPSIVLFCFFLVYVDIGHNPGDMATLSFTFGSNAIGNRIWEIKITQIETMASHR